MTISVLALLVVVWMTWSGYRRGAVGMVVGCLPFFAAASVFLLTVWTAIRCGWSSSSAAVSLAGIAFAVLTFFSIRIILLRTFVYSRDRYESCAGRAGCLLCFCDRAAGALLGTFRSVVVCILIALLGSAAVYVGSRNSGSECVAQHGKPDPDLYSWVRTSCCDLAGLFDSEALSKVSGLGDVTREVRALVVLLGATDAEKRLIYRKLDLEALTALPEVQKALLDEEYMQLLDRLYDKDLTALYPMLQNTHTRTLVMCQEIQEIAGRLKPSDLVVYLQEQP